MIWGKKPEFIKAYYTTGESSTKKESLLLLSGWWGLSRHFHYVPEIMAAFCWSVPGVFASHSFYPLMYVSFLIVLLFDRAYRDDVRCREKYGSYWD